MARLPRESVEESVRSYFTLCTMLLSSAQSAEESLGFWEHRMEDYVLLVERWQRLARVRRDVAQS